MANWRAPPPLHQEAGLYPGKKWFQGQALRRQTCPRPLEETTGSCPVSAQSAADQTPPGEKWGTEKQSFRTCFRKSPLPWEEGRPEADMPYVLPGKPGRKAGSPESLGRGRLDPQREYMSPPQRLPRGETGAREPPEVRDPPETLPPRM